MLRPSLTLAAVVMIGAGARAQSSVKSRLHPITGPVKNAGIYHVGTGTWTRHTTQSNVTGPDTIYNNTCAEVYYGAMVGGGNEIWAHRSCVPSPTHPTV